MAEDVSEEVLDVMSSDAAQLTGQKGGERARAIEIRSRATLTIERCGGGRSKIRIQGSQAAVKKAIGMLRALCAFREAAAEEEQGFCRWFAAGFCRFGEDCGEEGCEDGAHNAARVNSAQAAWLRPPASLAVPSPADGAAGGVDGPGGAASGGGAGAGGASARPLLLAIGCAADVRGRGENNDDAVDGEDELLELAVIAVCPLTRRQLGRFHRFVRPAAWAAEEAEEAAGEGGEAEAEVEAEAPAEMEAEAEPGAEVEVAAGPEGAAEGEEDEVIDIPAAGDEERAGTGAGESGDAGARDAAPEAAAEAAPPSRPQVRERFPAACFNDGADAAAPFPSVLADLLDWLPGLLGVPLDEVKLEDVLLVTVRDWEVQVLLPRQCNLPEPGTIDETLQGFLFSRWACLKDIFRLTFTLSAVDAPAHLRAMQRYMALPFTDEQVSRYTACMEETAGVALLLQELLKSGWAPQPTAWRETVSAPTQYLLACVDTPAGPGLPLKRSFEEMSGLPMPFPPLPAAIPPLPPIGAFPPPPQMALPLQPPASLPPFPPAPLGLSPGTSVPPLPLPGLPNFPPPPRGSLVPLPPPPPGRSDAAGLSEGPAPAFPPQPPVPMGAGPKSVPSGAAAGSPSGAGPKSKAPDGGAPNGKPTDRGAPLGAGPKGSSPATVSGRLGASAKGAPKRPAPCAAA